jgi:hypothetical protein
MDEGPSKPKEGPSSVSTKEVVYDNLSVNFSKSYILSKDRLIGGISTDRLICANFSRQLAFWQHRSMTLLDLYTDQVENFLVTYNK